MHRCQQVALPASFITLQVNKTIFYNTTGNLNNERMFLFSTTFSGLLLSGPSCTTVDLYEYLLTKGIGECGTAMTNRQLFPKCLRREKRQMNAGDSVMLFNGR